MIANMIAGWTGFLLGCIAGAVPGLFFYNKNWLGGYTSWQRRMIRLAHIAFFGIGLINISFAFTVHHLMITDQTVWASKLLIVGAIAMPVVCYLSAWKPFFRQLFFIPALSVTLAIIFVLWRIVIS